MKLTHYPITAQLDFSATPRFQKGAIFPWTISDYPLKQAILDGIVKRPMKGIAKIELGKSEYASVKYKGYLTAAIERWKEYRNQLKPLNKKPVLFIMMNSTEEADDVAEWIAKAYPPLLKRSFLTQDLAPVSQNLARVAEIGLQALDDLQGDRLISTDARQRNIEFLKLSAKPQAVLLLMVAPSVELLVQAIRTQ